MLGRRFSFAATMIGIVVELRFRRYLGLPTNTVPSIVLAENIKVESQEFIVSNFTDMVCLIMPGLGLIIPIPNAFK